MKTSITYDDIREYLNINKSQMSSSERLKRYLRGEEVDHIPYGLYALDQASTRMYGYDVIQYSTDIEVRKDVIRKNYENFGLDTFSVGLSLKMLGVALGSQLYSYKNRIEEIGVYALDNIEEFEKVKAIDLSESKILKSILDTAKSLKEDLRELNISTSVAGPLSTIVSLRPVEKIFRDGRKNPDFLHELLDLAVEGSLYWVKLFRREIGSVNVNITDPITSSGLISEKQFKEFSLPYIKRLVNGIMEIMDKPPSMHVCGYSKQIWNYLAETGISMFSLDNIEDIGELKDSIGDKITISGNVNPVDSMKYGTISDVIDDCVKCIEKGSNSKNGFILNTGCQVPIDTPIENVYAFIYAVKRYGKKAKIGEYPQGLSDYRK